MRFFGLPFASLFAGASFIMITSAAMAAEGTSDTASASSPVQAVPFTDVRIADNFWAPRKEINRKVTLPHALKMLDKAGNIKDLKLAAARERSGYQGPLFIDSDLYKAVEAISYSLAEKPDAEVEKQLDEIIAMIADAQQPDGYLNTWIQVVAPEKRWSNLRDQHELYCAGHLFEAAVAHHAATGKRTLLDVAIKFADHIDSVFGNEPGKRDGYPGHEEIELALIKLWRTTGEQRYFDLAKFFLESRGSGFFAKEHGTNPEEYDGRYWQDNAKLRDHKKIVGHAVRAVYLLCGATDYAAVTKDAELIEMLERVWKNTTGANMYVTGGIGSSAANEGFTHDYDLPNFEAYQETCASIAMAMWNQRMMLLSRDARYADCMERALYNGFLSGPGLDGTKFFYVNPLASHGKHHRKEWYTVACCPPNIARTFTQLGGYVYARSPGALWVNLYIAGSMETELDGKNVGLEVATEYPWDGEVTIRPQLTSAMPFELRLRAPGWCEGETVTVNGTPLDSVTSDSGYLVINRTWQSGDELVLNLPMPVRRIAADPRVEANAGRLAIQRGPIVYCLEEADNSVPVHQVALARDATLKPMKHPDLLGGIVALTGTGSILQTGTRDDHQLYGPAKAEQQADVFAIPYYAWDNREAGDMAVWIPTTPPPPSLAGAEADATAAMSYVGKHGSPLGAQDGSSPKKSSDLPPDNCHWWPHKGGEEWVQYSWDAPHRISSSRVYWFDDTGRGECRVPESWALQYKDGDQWKPVALKTGDYVTAIDQWIEVEFEPVVTKELRLVVTMQDGFAAGVHEWQVNGTRE